MRRGAAIPATEDYMDHVDHKLAPLLMIFDVLHDDLKVRFQGTGISERRKLDQTAQSWFAGNEHLIASNVVTNIWAALRIPCGIWSEAQFVTTVQRRLTVEALSLPLAAQHGRPPRWVNISVGLAGMDYDERAMGWHGDVKLGWFDAGFGIPTAPILPVA
ncbi:MAG: hypothetical protein JNK21_10055 [Rhodospirillaceae bacterium]|nr:hypothetical protein [Rhodospirillaceae bacterium]